MEPGEHIELVPIAEIEPSPGSAGLRTQLNGRAATVGNLAAGSGGVDGTLVVSDIG